MADFVGRSEPLGRLLSAFRAATDTSHTVSAGPPLVLVTGEAGIGKSSLLHRFASEVEEAGGSVGWGTCWDDEQAPAWWPWTEALRRLRSAGVSPDLADLLSPVLGETGRGDAISSEPGGRLRLMDGIARLLSSAAAEGPVVVVLDDLQWSDPSTLDLVSFLVRRPADRPLVLVGAYRPGEARREVASALAELAMSAELVPLPSMTGPEVAELVAAVAGNDTATQWAGEVHARSGGHPFFARELCRMLAAGADPRAVPPVVQDVVARRLEALSPACTGVLAVAAVTGSDLSVDLVAEVSELDRSTVLDRIAEATDASILVERADGPAFCHDLYRESVLATLPAARRVEIHGRVTRALVARRERGVPVHSGELARHAAASLSGATSDQAQKAVAWAREAAQVEESRFAFAEAAAHLDRVRRALTETGQKLSTRDGVQLKIDEADLRLKAGRGLDAHRLLEEAWDEARALADAQLMGSVAVGLDRCGARFAMPRDQLLGVLESARLALEGSATPAEAQVTAALARQLQHSVPADRPRAKPLAETAVRIARGLGDDATLASCLLAQHDTLWTAGTADRRVAIAQEIAGVARAAGDRERHAQSLLLAANAQLEGGSPAFRATLAEYVAVSRALRQPGHDYLVRTREAALALLDGDLERGDRLSAEAAELGEAVGDTDTGNVRMSQRLEVVRAQGDPAELRAFAAKAVQWWVGIPAHAHAVGAGFLARAGDLPGADRELAIVLSLDDWRADRSYMWSVFVGQVATAAIALRRLDVCRQLIDDLRPLRSACAVNGALVCFMGAHAHHLGLLYAAVGDQREARQLLSEALHLHQRLGARAWQAETEAALADLESGGVVLRRTGGTWEVSYRGRSSAVRQSKGMQDLAVLVARPGVEVTALELAAGASVTPQQAESVLDRTALAAYRSRLRDLDEELEAARAAADRGREERASLEREQVLTELRRDTRPGGHSRSWDNRDTERARKAVSARIRDAIARIDEVLPELGRHLDRSVTTGTACRYEPRPD